ncbi:MAG: alpha/beta hydrolase [Gammaproteobacteria bacterium]|nr:alpha/beta hydrolase [Gammaproteobacteria bacterium]
MKDFSSLSKVEQQAFPGAQNSYDEPPPMTRSDVIWMTAKDSDGDWVAGIFTPGDASNDLAVIHFYGNNETLKASEYVFQQLRGRGFPVLMFDYRGYGASRGRPKESAFYSDAELIYDWLSEAHPELRIAVSGWAIGSAVAIYLAQARRVEGLLLFSPPTNMIDVVKHVFPPDQVIIEEAMPFHFDTLDTLPNVRCPIFICHGKNDPVIPYSMSEELERLAKAPVTRYVLDAGHNDLFIIGGDRLWNSVAEFLRSLKS